MQVFNCHKSQKIYEKAVFTCLLMLDYVLDYYKTQELYDKVLALFWAQIALKVDENYWNLCFVVYLLLKRFMNFQQ